MAMKMLHALVASVLLAALVSTAQACTQTCPANYVVVPSGTACDYSCATQYKPECMPQPTLNMRTRQWQAAAPATTIQKEAAKARVCGGNDINANPCPAIACAYSASYAISGPLGCSTAGSYITELAISSTEYDFKNFFKSVIQSYATSLCSAGGYSANSLTAQAAGAARAFAIAVATTISHYNTYVCTCCYNNNAAQTTVSGAVQAVATAIADALSESEGAVYDCNGNPLSLSTTQTEAFALDVKLAIDTVHQTYFTSLGGANCGSSCYTNIVQAVAKSAACAFTSIFAQASDSVTQSTTGACASTFTVSGTEPDCTFTTNCKAACS